MWYRDPKDFGLETSNSTYIVAEAGINHDGNLETAKRLVEAAAEAGCDAVKFQTYKTEKRVPKESPLFPILKKCELRYRDFDTLNQQANDLGIDFFSTPFDEEAVDLLGDIGCKIFKISSFDIVNHSFLRYISKTNTTIIMSVGMANSREINEAYEIISATNNNIVLLHCISAYPTRENESNIASISKLKQIYPCLIGQSDHTQGIKVPTYSVAAGAQVIEKHFKITDNHECVDAAVSISMSKMKEMIHNIRELEEIIGIEQTVCSEVQMPCRQFRRTEVISEAQQ